MAKRDRIAEKMAAIMALDRNDKLARDPSSQAPPGAPARRSVPAPAQLKMLVAARWELEERIDDLVFELAFGKPQVELPVALIDPCPWQQRSTFDAGAGDGLVDSTAVSGSHELVVVRRVAAYDGTTRYQLIAGDCCLHTHRQLQKETIWAVVVVIDDKAEAALALAENIFRVDYRHDSEIREATLDVCRQVKELTYALRRSSVPIPAPILLRAVHGGHHRESIGMGTPTTTRHERSYKLVGGPDGGSARHATPTGEPISKEKQATCKHEWEPDGQTLTSVQWTCSKCRKTIVSSIDI